MSLNTSTQLSASLDVIRQQFPALKRPVIFFDNPGGTQVAQQSIDRITRYLVDHNANHEGAFATSIASDAVPRRIRLLSSLKELSESWQDKGVLNIQITNFIDDKKML